MALAIDALRHGWPIVLDDTLTLLPAETGFGPGVTAPRMLISATRAATLELPNQNRGAAPEAPVIIHAEGPFDLALARAVADPALDFSYAMSGPFTTLELDNDVAYLAALELARLAGVLPAFLIDPRPPGEAQGLRSTDLAEWKHGARLTIAARANLPIAACDVAQIVAFRSADDLREHVALVIGGQDGDRPPLVRVHSECLTGDVLGSLKCDCGAQLDAALAAMALEAQASGWGVLLYLRQEGRGIGLINKLRAYGLQDRGIDTVDANTRLGLPVEARDFAVAARMLDLLGIRAIRLMTNNPAKMAALEGAGVAIVERVPHQLPANRYNARYLATKRDRAGHILTNDTG